MSTQLIKYLLIRTFQSIFQLAAIVLSAFLAVCTSTAVAQATNAEQPFMDLEQYIQLSQQVQTLIENGLSYEEVYQTLAPSNTSLRQRRFVLQSINFVGTELNRGKIMARSYDKARQHYDGTQNQTLDLLFNQNCDLMIFNFPAFVQMRDGALPVEDTSIRWKFPIDQPTSQSIDLAIFLSKSFLELSHESRDYIFAHPEKNTEQLINEFNAQCRFRVEQ